MATMYHPAGSGWEAMADIAWATRENAQAIRTKVGCAVLATTKDSDGPVGSTGTGRIFGGCNIEDLWKASSIHAERTAIACAIAAGLPKITHVLVAAEREKFTPCGNCMDFIFQFGGPECIIGFQGTPGGKVDFYTARELMPEYPC